MKLDPKISISNVVASFRLEGLLDLEKINESYRSVSTLEFWGRLVLVMRLISPKMTLILNESGKVVCSGAQDIRAASRCDKRLSAMLIRIGIRKKIMEPAKIHNLVAVASYGRDLDLDEITLSMENVEYEPEQFPGAVIRMPTSHATFLVFPTGKVVCLGCKSTEEVKDSIQLIFTALDRLK